MYLAVLGRQSEISLAELEALHKNVFQISEHLAVFESDTVPNIDRLGGSLKLAEMLDEAPIKYLSDISEGKITFAVSDYTKGANPKSANLEAMKLKKILVRHGRSVRVVQGKSAVLSSATSLHNGLSGKNPRKYELIKVGRDWYRVIGVQDIDAYTRRDQARPYRDAKVGMLPPKLAQILINLCGPLKSGALKSVTLKSEVTVLDPFCGTGVLLQEALLLGYSAYGTDISERMIEYSEKNLKHFDFADFRLEVGDATNHRWTGKIDAVACEGYLGAPMSNPPSEMKLKEQKQICSDIILGFLKNLGGQIEPGTPVVIAVPAWLRPDGTYSRLEIVDNLGELGYNVNNKSLGGLLYYREGQIVARDIIILRKK